MTKTEIETLSVEYSPKALAGLRLLRRGVVGGLMLWVLGTTYVNPR